MFQPYTGPLPEPVHFLLIPGYSMMALFSAVEPLRAANRLAGRTLFRTHVYSLDGAPVEASNGMSLVTESGIEGIDALPNLTVVAGFDWQRAERKPLLAWLRALARRHTVLGGIDTGPHLLARAGLLDGCRVTMHWESVAAFAEAYPQIEVSDELFEIGNGRFSCAGGIAALDMMLHMIASKYGQELAIAVSEQFIHDRIRRQSDHQRMQLAARLGVHNARLVKVVEVMLGNLEEPLPSAELARMAGISVRQLERLFRTHLRDTPSGYYLKQRLDRARQLLQQSQMSVMDVAMACGFASASSLSRAYRTRYGRPPRADRRGT